MATAGAGYGQLSGRYFDLTVPMTSAAQARGLPSEVEVSFPGLGSDEDPAAVVPSPTGYELQPAGGLLDQSAYARTWDLAQRLRERSRTPYEYVRRVLGHLARGYAYSESPPRHSVPLEAFLFEDRIGYCQHFSGAMALLLRMGGVPARVAGGFSPGSFSSRRRDYVVRDFDAHSWVEVWFPDIGWVTFDPTPAASPARSQLINVDLPDATAPAGLGGLAQRGDAPEPGPRAAGGDGGGGGGGIPFGLVALALAAVGGAAFAAVRWRSRGAGGRRPADPDLAELLRALRRTGRPVHDGTTLTALERRLAFDSGAAGYLRALRERRYGFGGGGPTAQDRRGLRRALSEGLGPAGRLRGLWALPPRPRRST
jgi:hypothetical protein